MSAPPRWSDAEGPTDPDLRAALRDARRGPSDAQLAGLMASVAARMEARVPSPRRTRLPRWLALVAALGVLGLVGRHALHAPDPVITPVPAPAHAIPPIVEVPSTTPEPRPAPLVLTPAPRPKSRAPRPSQPAPASAPRTSDHDEVALLGAAQKALPFAPARALALTQEHGARFRDSALIEEREAIAIEALFRLARRPEAERALASFRERHPGSTYTTRLVRWKE